MRALALVCLAACSTPPAGTSPRATGTPPVESARGASCAGASLLPVPADLAARGPWAVGARTVKADDLTVEVWYPALPGSDAGKAAHVRYDLRTVMPPAEAAKISDADNAWLDCDCVRDLPLDDAHGPYPVVVFLHGAASFRAQSAFLATHWASRGFVVVAPDLPGAGLASVMGGGGGSPMAAPGEIMELVTRAPEGVPDPLAFVRAKLGTQVALAGHSLGSVLAATVERPEVAVRISLAGFGGPEGGTSRLVMLGDHDSIARADGAKQNAEDAQPVTRLMIVKGAGHLAFTDLCLVGADRGGALAIAKAHGVNVPEMIVQLGSDGCRPTDAPFATTAPPIRAATAGVLEETLRCDPAATRALAGLGSAYAVDWVERVK